jgi:hypothetical protein
MKGDPRISRLMKESGIVHAPEGFTDSVMSKIVTEPKKRGYRPLISRWGIILTLTVVVILVLVSVFYSDAVEGQSLLSQKLPRLQWQMPEMSFNLDFLSNMQISTGVVATLVALFVLVLTDAVVRKRLI